MAVDVVFPDGNEESFIHMAERLGYSEIIFLYKRAVPMRQFNSRVKVRRAFFVDNLKDVERAARDFELIFAPALREFFENKRSGFLVNAEELDMKDSFHQRRSGLDDVMCKLAAKKEKVLVFNTNQFSFSDLVLGRMLQNARLCRKYKLKTLVVSFASAPLEMRAPKDLDGFARLIKLR